MTSAEGQDGFTLLETLIAFLILAGAFVISAQTIAIAAKSISLSKERTEVLRLVKVLRLETVPHILQDDRGKEVLGLTFEWDIRSRSVVGVDPMQSSKFAVVAITAPSGREHRFIYFETDRQNAR
ncbi:hypothetical protein ABVB70_26310 [Agrobacterium radiobacter]|uniref:General secretion pathway protein I n=1 Tax=Agrobacterium radiobacter TaxID=362 RepID=A0ABD5LTS2_AGRRD